MEVAQPQPRRMTFAEYVERELRSDYKSEYHGGEVLAMSGGTIDHSRVIRNLAWSLTGKLRGKPCEPFESNLRVYVRAFDRGFYPDAQVICGPVEYYESDRNRTTVLNPTVVFEVLSPSTSQYDRSEKLRAYLGIPSLKQYVLIETMIPYVEIYTRRDDGWLRTHAAGLESVARLESIDVELKLSELYLTVEFAGPEQAESTEPTPPER
jgi:Uma2 family endonuclease